jgi:hypothetical protein
VVFVIETEDCIRYELGPKEMLTMQRQQSNKTYISLFTTHRFKWMQISCKDMDKTHSVLWIGLGKSHCECLPHWPRFFSEIFTILKCRDRNRERTSKMARSVDITLSVTMSWNVVAYIISITREWKIQIRSFGQNACNLFFKKSVPFGCLEFLLNA